MARHMTHEDLIHNLQILDSNISHKQAIANMAIQTIQVLSAKGSSEMNNNLKIHNYYKIIGKTMGTQYVISDVVETEQNYVFTVKDYVIDSLRARVYLVREPMINSKGLNVEHKTLRYRLYIETSAHTISFKDDDIWAGISQTQIKDMNSLLNGIWNIVEQYNRYIREKVTGQVTAFQIT